MTWEVSITQGLMRFVAGITVEVVGWMGIPAVQHANLVEVGTGMIGIDEACSGVRSLQSAFMLSLFLGEMNQFSVIRRTALLGASLLLVVAANITRTTFLVWTGANRGLGQLEAWHDAAGMLVMLIVLPALLGLAWFMKPKTSRSLRADRQAWRRPVWPRWAGVAAISWIGACMLATEVWYRAHETGLAANARWSVVWPEQSPEFKKTELPRNSLAVLRCSNSDSAVWQDEAGNDWSGFVLRWNPGRNSAQLARGHRPEICFPASGARLLQDYGLVSMPVGGVDLVFHHQSFETAAGLAHVFYSLSSDRGPASEAALLDDGSYASRIQAVAAGRRNLGQQVLEIVVHGPESGAEAAALLQLRLPGLIRCQ
jgi:exosortase/archaeosortase family protein